MHIDQKTIVIFDLEEAIRTVLSAELTSEAYRTYPFEFATEACDFVIQNQPDMILSDIKLNYMDGFEFLTFLKKNRFTQNIPFLYVTGYADLKTAIWSKMMGACDFVSKPYDLVDLFETIERVLTENRDISKTTYDKSIDNTPMDKHAFCDWETICRYFVKNLSRYSTHHEVPDNSAHWHMDFLFTQNKHQYFDRLVRPYTYDKINPDILSKGLNPLVTPTP
jgi:CheY-like chemotaxis protein